MVVFFDRGRDGSEGEGGWGRGGGGGGGVDWMVHLGSFGVGLVWFGLLLFFFKGLFQCPLF